jgi:hypothetical protein
MENSRSAMKRLSNGEAQVKQSLESLQLYFESIPELLYQIQMSERKRICYSEWLRKHWSELDQKDKISLRKIVADIEEFDLIQEGDHMLVELEDDQL